MTMTDATAAFFHDLGRRGHERSLEKATGTIKVELSNGGRPDRWLVTLDHGDVVVSHRGGSADCTLVTTSELFDEVVRGEANAMAAVMRGSIDVAGSWELLVLFQRLFPGPGSADEGSVR
jgi:putative sterol carrier protein